MSTALAEPVGGGRPRRGRDHGQRELRRGQLGALAVLLGLAAAAWLVSDLRMAGMDAGPATDPGGFGFYITTWVVMMGAMMLPSIGPMVLTYRNLQAGRRRQGQPVPSGAVGLFVAAYLLVWGTSGLVAYGALKLGRAAGAGWLGWHHAGRWVVVAVLAMAALYELTPWKNACLMRCRSPLGFLVTRWRDARFGALRMGLEHGAWCLGCCWLLMVVLFALGAMSITWMIVITALIAAEKLLPRRIAGITLVALVLGALALGMATAPQDVPGLTVPGAPRGSMSSMQMHPMNR